MDDERERGGEGFPEPPGKDPGDRSDDETPHSSLNTPVDDH